MASYRFLPYFSIVFFLLAMPASADSIMYGILNTETRNGFTAPIVRLQDGHRFSALISYIAEVLAQDYVSKNPILALSDPDDPNNQYAANLQYFLGDRELTWPMAEEVYTGEAIGHVFASRNVTPKALPTLTERFRNLAPQDQAGVKHYNTVRTQRYGRAYAEVMLGE